MDLSQMRDIDPDQSKREKMKSKQQKLKERESRTRLNETRADFQPDLRRKLSDFASQQPKKGGKSMLESV